jgi:hypothetical protein
MHTHLLHVQCLLVHGAVRNSWLQDEGLRVRILPGMLIQDYLPGLFPELRKQWERYLSLPDPAQGELLRLLQSTAAEFRSKFKITKPGLRKQGYRDLSLVDKEEEQKVFCCRRDLRRRKRKG